jgi:hypothetical protein
VTELYSATNSFNVTMKNVIQTFLRPSSGRKSKSKRRSSSTDFHLSMDGGSSSDPLDLSHATLRSRVSFQLEDPSDGRRLSSGNNQNNSSFSFVGLIPEDENTSDDVVDKLSPAEAAPITVKHDSEGTMDTSHSVDDYEEDEVLYSRFVVKYKNKENSVSENTTLSHPDEPEDFATSASHKSPMDDVFENHPEAISSSSMPLQTIHEALQASVAKWDSRASLFSERTPPSALRKSTRQTSSTSSTSTTTAAEEKHVRFGQLEIHEHLVAIGGAVPSSGPSLTLKDESQASFSLSVEDYETYRPAPPRKGTQLLRSKTQRIEL